MNEKCLALEHTSKPLIAFRNLNINIPYQADGAND